MKLQNVELFTNEHDITMLRLTNEGKTFKTFISTKKAASILNTELDASKIEVIQKHGRELFKVTHADGKGSFNVGENKINSVLNNKDEIMQLFEAIHSQANA